MSGSRRPSRRREPPRSLSELREESGIEDSAVDGMVLTVVGSGTLLPDAERGSASFHLRVQDHSLLLDAGPGTLHGLPRAGIPWRGVDTLALSHFHPDHVGDVPALLAAFRFEELTAPLTVVGPRGVSDLMERMAALHGAWILEPSRPLTIVELGDGDGWSSKDGAVRLESAPTPHTEESVAYRITGGGVSVGYTGDTGPSTSLHEFLGGCALIVAECALADPPELDTHLSPRSVADLAGAADPDLLVISHVYPPLRPAEAVARVRASYAGRVVAARDGLRIGVSRREVTVDPSPEVP